MCSQDVYLVLIDTEILHAKQEYSTRRFSSLSGFDLCKVVRNSFFVVSIASGGLDPMTASFMIIEHKKLTKVILKTTLLSTSTKAANL